MLSVLYRIYKSLALVSLDIAILKIFAILLALLEKSAGHCKLLPKALSALEIINQGRLKFSLPMSLRAAIIYL